jgi:hypothetical protein
MDKLIKAMTLAASKLGTKEATGNNDGAFMNECLSLTGLDNQKQFETTGKGYAWCAAFVSWVLYESGANAIKTAWAPSWFPESKLVKNGKYRPMDVAAINYNKVVNGHVFFIWYWPEEGDTFISLDGNWGNVVGLNLRNKADVSAVSRWI